MDNKCNLCGTSLDEVPFEPCEEHRAYSDSRPPLTERELDEVLDQERLQILYERTGDD